MELEMGEVISRVNCRGSATWGTVPRGAHYCSGIEKRKRGVRSCDLGFRTHRGHLRFNERCWSQAICSNSGLPDK